MNNTVHTNQTKQQCMMLKNGEEFIFTPITSPIHHIMRQISMIMVDKFGVHLMRLGIFSSIHSKTSPHKYLESQCIELAKDERSTLMRIEGHSIKQPQNDPILTPDLIVSAFPIDLKQPPFMNAKTCKDICSTQPLNQCICIKYSQLKSRDIVYIIPNIDAINGTKKYFNTIGSVIGFNRFNVFNHELTGNPDPTSSVKYEFELMSNSTDSSSSFIGGHSSEHILLNLIPTKQHDVKNDPIIKAHLSLRNVVDFKGLNVNMTAVSLEAMNGKDIPKTCVMNELNHECLFSVYSEFDNHISVENGGKYTENFTLELIAGDNNKNDYGYTQFEMISNSHHQRKVRASNAICVIIAICALFTLIIAAFIYVFEKSKKRMIRERYVDIDHADI